MSECDIVLWHFAAKTRKVKMGVKIVITSGKGGTGKTSSTAAIAEALAIIGKRVLCVDCDVGLRNLDLALGVQDEVLFDFYDAMAERVELKDAIMHHPEISNLDFLSAPSDMAPGDIDEAEFNRLFDSAAEDYDFILFDSPAGLGAGFRLAATPADMGIVVATADTTSLRDGQKTVNALKERGIENVRLLVNRVQKRQFRRIRSSVDDIIDSVGAQLIGVVSEDESIPIAANLGVPLMRYGARYAFDQYERIARRICGERVYIGKI